MKLLLNTKMQLIYKEENATINPFVITINMYSLLSIYI